MKRPETLDEMREVVAEFLQSSPDAGKFWDLITCLRGPDSPSERGDMTREEHERAYAGRRERKRQTVEVIRYRAFGGVVGGSARHRDGCAVHLPERKSWDHFDRHVERAAKVLGLKVIVKGEVER